MSSTLETPLYNAIKDGERLLPNMPRRWLSKYGALNPRSDLESKNERHLIETYRALRTTAEQLLPAKKASD
ncbi:hypothetical protein ERW49_08325 [Aliivibrio finisterrensis]|uniref:Uncharacterized protein n=1 Tax=Aliivibrio finisterrensis TaxID=511998 RepID=A0A4Q5KME7_9GAMM|nr:MULTISPECIES: hypothetical protein [Aliivibrio]MDD9175516.1 hypothetical protein [Aliivibrio sp. S3TY1]MDD9192595.1 hypothetical protein [Aliivibrio sp. S2TY2]MDD9200354.1 hypothetical protein [Aliivibrio sp. S2MY1]RYU46598.1 hypothetical protein ERW49_08325 [Aliivibrio finisterrensis]